MTRNIFYGTLKTLPRLLCIMGAIVIMLLFPREISQGVKEGIVLCGEKIIPSLFPFMILASYISSSSALERCIFVFDKLSRRLFRVNAYGLTAVILGFLGGYPIGAKAVCDFYTAKRLSQDEATRLLPWCINPGPAFVITAVGAFMLGSTKIGVIMYASIICSSVSIGIACRFLGKNIQNEKREKTPFHTTGNFVYSVASATDSMLSICGWVLMFSAISKALCILIKNKLLSLFICSVAEVTTGCVTLTNASMPIPLICAILGFGGFAVIFQVAPYVEKCSCSLKRFIFWKAVNGILSGFYCSLLLRIYPVSISTSVTSQLSTGTPALSHSLTAAVLLIIICIVFILEVDYKKKIC